MSDAIDHDRPTFRESATAEWHARPVSTLAALIGMIVIVASVFVQWGITSHRLDTLERDEQGTRDLVTSQMAADADQEARIRVIESRIVTIEATVQRTDVNVDRLLELQGDRR